MRRCSARPRFSRTQLGADVLSIREPGVHADGVESTGENGKAQRRAKRHQRRSRRRMQHETLERRNLLAVITGEVWSDANSDGVRQLEEDVAAEVRVFLDTNNNSVVDAGEPLTQTDAAGVYSFDGLDAGDYIVRIDAALGTQQTAPGLHYGVGEFVAADMSTEIRLFTMGTDGEVRLIGAPIGRNVDGLVQTNDGTLVAVDSVAGELLTLDRITGAPTVVASLSGIVGGGLAYDPANDIIYAVGKDTDVSTRFRLQELNPTDGTLTAIGTGTTTPTEITGMTFDRGTGRILAHDSTTNTLVAFQSDGLAIPLDSPSLPNTSGSLAAAASSFLLVDPPGRDGGSVLSFDASNGNATALFDLSTPLTVTALDDLVTQGVPAFVTLVDNAGVVEDATGVDFGISGMPLEIVLTPTNGDTSVSLANREDTFSVRLASQPNSNVTLGVFTPSTALELGATELVFTPDDWSQPQDVTLKLLGATTEASTQIVVSLNPGASDPAWNGALPQLLDVQIDGTTGTRLRPAYISEVLVDPLFGDNDTDQYLELRGRPGATLPQGSYLVVVDEGNVDEGEIQNIFDLSGQQFGANGYLVLLQDNSPHQPVSGATVLQSNAAGFGGLPGGIYSDSNNINDRINAAARNVGFFLIQTDVVPNISDDIDADSDGLIDPDGIASNWNILDSVSLHNTSTGNQAYGQFVAANFVVNPQTITTAPGVNVLFGTGSGYVGRVGASLGHEFGDWVFGTVREDGPEDPQVFELSDDLFGPALPASFYGRDLDHVGDDNFIGGVQGSFAFERAFDDPDDSPGSLPSLAGIPVLADTNGNGVQDVLTFNVEPDDAIGRVPALGVPASVSLTNAYPGVSIRSFSSGNVSNGNITAEMQTEFPLVLENHVFAQGGIDFFTPLSQLRFDFDRPARSVAITALADDISFTPVYGRLEAYDADDNLLGFIRSTALFQGASAELSLSFGSDIIAYAVAFSDSDFDNSSPFGRFDSFSYTQSEALAFTDDSGVYELAKLVPGDYDITFLQNGSGNTFFGDTDHPITITQYENFQFFDTGRINSLPVVSDLTIQTVENPTPGVPLGQLFANELDGQTVSFAWVDGETFGLDLDPVSGIIRANAQNELDFETRNEFTLTARVTDELGGFSDAAVTFMLSDVNEPPVPIASEIVVSEAAANGEVVGRVIAIDPDQAPQQNLLFEITGGSAAGALSIRPDTGQVVVADASLLDFETNPNLTLFVRVHDDGSPSLSGTAQQTIRVTDANDAPVLITQSLTIPETANGVVGQLVFTDSDQSQQLAASLAGGTGVGIFDVDRDGSVRLRDDATIDFESQEFYTLDVVVSDNGAPPAAGGGTVLLQILDVNEPAELAVQQASISEDAIPGTSVAVLSLQDPEGLSGFSSLTLVPVANPPFDFDPITGLLSVANGADLDFETTPQINVDFLIRDLSGAVPETPATFVVNLLDANDAPMILTSEFGISELTTPGTLVNTVEAFDPDQDPLSFAIVGGTGAGLFVIDDATGEIRVADGASFDADVPESSTLLLDIETVDPDNASDLQTITVTINDVNEPPQFVGTLPELTVASGETLEFQIPEDLVVDPENRDFLLSVGDASGQLPDWLSFDRETRVLSGTPNPFSQLPPALFVTAFEPAGQAILSSQLELPLTLSTSDRPLHNARNPFDVDGNGLVAALDALRVINFINRNGIETFYDGSFDFTQLSSFTGFVDVNADGFVTAQDALLVINAILRGAQSGAVGGEGEQAGLAQTAAPLRKADAVDEVFRDLEEGGLF